MDRYLGMWTSWADIEQIFGLDPTPTDHPADTHRNILLVGKIKSETSVGLWVQVLDVSTQEKSGMIRPQSAELAQLIRWDTVKSAFTIDGKQPTIETAIGFRPR